MGPAVEMERWVAVMLRKIVQQSLLVAWYVLEKQRKQTRQCR